MTKNFKLFLISLVWILFIAPVSVIFSVTNSWYFLAAYAVCALAVAYETIAMLRSEA